MTVLSRRDLLGASTVVACASLLPKVARAATERARPSRPRMLVQIIPRGGMDSMLTTDPKIRREVNSKIMPEYDDADILTVGDARFGPLFRPLLRVLPRFVVLNGVVASTVAHPIGVANIIEMRRLHPMGTGIGLSGTIGAALRGDAPLSTVYFDFGGGQILRPAHPASRSLLLRTAGPRGFLDRLSAIVRDEGNRLALARVFREEEALCEASGAACMPVDTVKALIERMPSEPLPPVADVPVLSAGTPNPAIKASAAMWRDVIFLLRHRLTASVCVVPPFSLWDTHQFNLPIQKKCMDVFAPSLLHFLDELGRQRTVDGALLADEVGIVIASEFGRFPVVNEYEGKDHFPECPAVLIGPGLRPGQYGQTDQDTISTPVSLKTGHSGSDPATIIPTVDDLGATLLHWFGLEDTRSLGYLGRRLDFLFA